MNNLVGNTCNQGIPSSSVFLSLVIPSYELQWALKMRWTACLSPTSKHKILIIVTNYSCAYLRDKSKCSEYIVLHPHINLYGKIQSNFCTRVPKNWKYTFYCDKYWSIIGITTTTVGRFHNLWIYYYLLQLFCVVIIKYIVFVHHCYIYYLLYKMH